MRTASKPVRENKRKRGERGLTVLQLVIVVVIATILMAFALIGIANARQRIRLTNSAHSMASYLERARADSVRRHPTAANQMSGIQMVNNTTYRVLMDFNGDGTMEMRDVTLEDGVIVATNPLPDPILFDWRGRLSNKVSITLQYGNSEGAPQVSIDITGSGDVTIDSDVYLDDVPDVNVNVNSLSGVDSGSTLNSNNNPHSSPSPNSSPTPTGGSSPTASPSPSPGASPSPSPNSSPSPVASPSPSPVASPSPSPQSSPSPPPCVVNINPTSISIKKNGGSTGTITFTVTGGTGSVSVATSPVPPSNLTITQNGNTFTVKSKNNSRGSFTVYFSTPCGQRSVVVIVTN